MVDRSYYAKRKGILNQPVIDFEKLKELFLQIFVELEHKLYFREVTGYDNAFLGRSEGEWGINIDTFIFLRTGYDNIWPIPENIENWDESILFTVIEFLYDYISQPLDNEYDQLNYFWYATKYNKEYGKKDYRNRINEILKNYNHGYQLMVNGEIQVIAPEGLESITEGIIQTEDQENIDKRIKNAVSKYKRHHATIDDKKEALRCLADILEYLKKEGIRLEKKDDSDLFNIINKFDIRHHNKFQQGDYNKELWYDWMFYTFLTSINVLLQLREQKLSTK